MLVFHKERLVLLAMPKTGTTALEEALLPRASAAILDPPGLKHIPAFRWKKRLAGLFEQNGRRPLEVVCTVREPIDWLGSWYRYRTRDQIAGTSKSTAGLSFDAFVQAWMSDDPPDCAQVGSPARFVSDGNGGMGVDHLFRHDRPEALRAFLEDRLGAPITLPRRNVSPVRALELSAETETALRQRRPEEFALWDRVCAGAD